MKYQFLIFSLLPQFLWAQYHFDFENDTILAMESCLNNPWEQIPAGRWECAREGAISGNFSLHHSFENPDAGCDYFILTHDPLQDTDSLSISFRVRHGYPPSSANNWQVAILADCRKGLDPAKDSNGVPAIITGGLILGVNFMGSDDLVKLWTCMDGNCEEFYVTSLNYQEQVGTNAAPEFKLVWYRGGKMDIYFNPDPEEFPGVHIGSCLLEILPQGRYLAVRYEYSSAQDRNLWMDDIKLDGNFARDTVAPTLESTKVLDDWHLQINFSEPVHIYSHLSFQLSGSGNRSMNPDSIVAIDGGVVLEFPGIIPNRETQQLRVGDICDADANCLSDTLITILRNEAEWSDVVFNELMVDPFPAVLLPEEEFLEIYNRSGYDLDLGGWRLEVNGQSHLIDEQIIEKYSFSVITGITLPNEGATLALFNASGTLVHSIRYALPWEGPDWKEEGGWSLESPDPEMVCGISKLWEYSSDPKGGTPGGLNSNDAALEDRIPPLLLYQGFGDQPGLIRLYYSEPIRFSPVDLEHFAVLPGRINPDSVTTIVPLSDQLLLWFSEDIKERSAFQIQIPAITDCAGNLSSSQELPSGKSAQVRSGCILINEVMYDPMDGMPEYIELYHPGENFFDLQDLALDVLEKGTSVVSPVPLSNHSRLVAPGEYLVITRTGPHLMEAYNLELTGRWIELKSMAGLPNSGGTVVLTDRNGGVVDAAPYGDHMHMELVDVTRGVSLERISADRPGSETNNWHSAASIEGYSTPGRENSQSVRGPESTDLLTVEPEVFSPDNDGFQDLLRITFYPGTQGWLIRMWVTDLTGNRIRGLANNHLAGGDVTYTWNGMQENGIMASGGIYVLHVWVYQPATGERRSWKRAFGLIYR